jgi:4-amino-4-deoxy-L-arabinose transferase-like glycosyltransferase/membrane-associated phospholipid phosphatase
MHWLQTLDVDLFRHVNQTLANPVFDQLMPFLSGNGVSYPILYALAVVGMLVLIWKQPARGLLFGLMLVLVIAVGDGLICNTLKHAVGRPRPFLALPDVRCLVGRGGSGSMPSSHAANCFAATMVAFIYYRRSVWFTAPIALLVCLSRVYNGVHFPSDVLAGALLGAGYAGAIVWSLNAAWQWAGQKWFPLWWEALPCLLDPSRRAKPDGEEEEAPFPPPRVKGIADPGFRPPHATLDQHWLRLGYLVVIAMLLAQWAYLASGTIELCEDEAYQWLWSKHLALSYYSKPPLIAYVQFLGTFLWGDNAFGVRFFSPLIAAILGVVTLRFFAREVNARAGFFLLLIMAATPLLGAGTVLMTVDPLSVLFWTLATFAGWRAIQPNAPTRNWLWVGLWMGLGFLSKYTELLQLLCWVVLFWLWRPARKHLRRPGPWLALLVNLLCALPVLIWNWQHGWVTVWHVAADAGSHRPLWPAPAQTLKYASEFLGLEFGLLNPIFFVAMVWAAIAFWRRGRQNPRLVYFFSMGAPLFLAYLLHSLRSRVLPNWIAPAVLPLFCLMVIYWDTQWRLGLARLKVWLTAGLVLGFVAVIFLHNTDITKKITGRYLPVKWDLLHRVRVWNEVARVTGEARRELLTEGKPVFIIGKHYGLVGLISFYLPEARAQVSDVPLVYMKTSSVAEDQFFFWPGYSMRKGENAIFVQELDRRDPQPLPPPPQIQNEFESVTDLGVRRVMYHGGLCRPIQVFACRNLR